MIKVNLINHHPVLICVTGGPMTAIAQSHQPRLQPARPAGWLVQGPAASLMCEGWPHHAIVLVDYDAAPARFLGLDPWYGPTGQPIAIDEKLMVSHLWTGEYVTLP